MQVYNAPLRDMRFVLHELFDEREYGGIEAFAELTPDLLDAVLEEAARFAQEVLLPLNASGDEEGCRLDNGVVRTPAGFKQAYDRFREGGWTALASDPEYGGQGLPERLNKLVEEMICSANLSFSLYPGLTHGATTAIEGHAPDAIRRAYLPKMVSGLWSGTMCLTEAHCGTDLGLLRTKAVPQADGSYRISGSKIFISAGDHDLTENVVHLVLARLADAPAGVKGISLFLVPKFLPKADGSPGPRNGVAVAGLEHKMGLKASATCQRAFDDAVGWLVGEPNKGLAAMFTMMNTERVSVGIQGLGVGEALVSVLDEKGAPTMVQKTLIRPPASRLGPGEAVQLLHLLDAGPAPAGPEVQEHRAAGVDPGHGDRAAFQIRQGESRNDPATFGDLDVGGRFGCGGRHRALERALAQFGMQ